MSSFLTNNAVDLPELTTPPAAPDAGRRKLYFGDDGNLYAVDGAGTVVPLSVSLAPRYVAYISQSGSAAPSPLTVYSNTIGDIVMTRHTTGTYRLANAAFNVEGIFVVATSFSAPSGTQITAQPSLAGYVTIRTYNSSGVLADGLLNHFVSIEVFS